MPRLLTNDDLPTALVTRIRGMIDEGMKAAQVADVLNAEGVPHPRGRWDRNRAARVRTLAVRAQAACRGARSG